METTFYPETRSTMYSSRRICPIVYNEEKRIKPRPSILHVLKVGLTIFVDAYHVNVGQLDPRPKVVIAANIAVNFFNGSDIYTEMWRIILTLFSRIEILGLLRWIPSF